MKIISLCDESGIMVRPWAEAGYECLCVDTQHSIRNKKQSDGITYLWADVRQFWPDSLEDIAAVFAFPPCTHLAVSGAQDWRKKGLTLLIDALQIVEACRRLCVASGGVWFIENPVGRLSTLWREPDYKFHPSDYAGYLDDQTQDAYSKITCLWAGGGFVMPEKKSVVPMGSRMHLLPPTPDRAKLRSKTPEGFARAVFKANHEHILRRAA